MIIHVCLFIIIICIIFVRKKVNKILKCPWKSKSVSYDQSRRDICKKYIDIINTLGIYYFIAFGSELGVIRNGGLIKNDVDIDIIVPISKNQHIFNCNENINVSKNYFDDKYIFLRSDVLLCNHNRLYYTSVLFKYIIQKFEKYGIIRFRLKSDVIAIYIAQNLYIDLYVTLANEYVYRDYNLCKCEFCNTTTFCHTNSYNLSKLLYGDDYLIESKKKSYLNTIQITKNSIV